MCETVYLIEDDPVYALRAEEWDWFPDDEGRRIVLKQRSTPSPGQGHSQGSVVVPMRTQTSLFLG